MRDRHPNADLMDSRGERGRAPGYAGVFCFWRVNTVGTSIAAPPPPPPDMLRGAGVGQGWGRGGARVGQGWGRGGAGVGQGWGRGRAWVGQGWGRGGARVGQGWGRGRAGVGQGWGGGDLKPPGPVLRSPHTPHPSQVSTLTGAAGDPWRPSRGPMQPTKLFPRQRSLVKGTGW